MRSQPSGFKAKGGRGRSQAGSRLSSARKSSLRRLLLEGLEDRTLMSTAPQQLAAAYPTSTLPSPVVSPQLALAAQLQGTLGPGSSRPPNVTQQTVDVSAVNGDTSDTSNESTPSIAVDKNNPNYLAAVWTRNDTSITGTTHVFVEGAYSTDGGRDWTALPQLNFLSNPTTSNPITSFPTITDASVAFDRNDNFYIIDLQSTGSGAGSANAVVLNKFNLTGGALNQVITDKIVYESLQDTAVSPTLAVDDNLSSFTQTGPNGQPYTQTDPTAGDVYVAWATNDTPVSPTPTGFNPDRILMVASSDGGNSFSGPVLINQNGSFGNQREATPVLAISQGRPADPAVYGASDKGVPGGQVSILYDDFGSGAKASPPVDFIDYNRTAGADSEVFSGPTGPIIDASSGTPSIITPTDFPVSVNITNPNFVLSDLSVSMAIQHPSVSDLTIVLIPPQSTGLAPFTLVTAGGATGANLGMPTNGTTTINGVVESSATFTDTGVRPINNSASSAPYMGYYRPQNGATLDGTFGGLTGAQLSGTWTLEITDTKNGNVGSLRNWSLNFTSGMAPGRDQTITTTRVRGTLSGANPLSAPVSPLGVGPGLSMASDNTLGAFSPFEGRLYMTYVDHINDTTNPATNTDVFMLASDDGGATWGPPAAPGQINANGIGNLANGSELVNDDLASKDGFSAGFGTGTLVNPGTGTVLGREAIFSGRTQFEPQVAVDAATGAVIVTFYDARNDAANARVATYIAASSDGGQAYAPEVFANDQQTATNAITGATTVIGPIPDNESPGNPNTDGTYSFGTHQGLAVYDGQIYPIWSSNENGINGSEVNDKEALDIRTSTFQIASGPRVISSTMGAVGLPGDTVNPQLPGASTPSVSAFQITFDRPVDPGTFTPSAVQVFFHDTTANNVSGGPVPVVSVVPIPTPNDPNNPNNIFGYTEFQVNFAARTAVGTYSYIISPVVADRIPVTKGFLQPTGAPQTFVATPPAVPKAVNSNQFEIISPITISGFGSNQVVANATVNLTLNHTDDSELFLALVSPNGTEIILSDQLQNPAAAGGPGYVNTTFDDSASTSIDNGTPPYTGTFKPDTPLGALDGGAINGTWDLVVFDVAGPDSGTLVNWSLTLTPGVQGTTTSSGNAMDQNANGNSGEAPVSGEGPGDAYSAPTSTATGSSFAWQANTFFPGPYDPSTLPLVLPGPHIVSSDVPGAPVTSNNLVLDNTVSAIDVTFDRAMNPATITPASILRIMGPLGQITGPFTVTPNPLGNDPNPSDPRTYRIGFPTQNLSGTYTITLASTIQSAAGDALDTNLNAGVDLLRGTPSTNSTGTLTVSSPNVPVVISPNQSVSSTLNVPNSLLVQGVTLTLNINYPHDPDLEATLVGPDGTSVKLFTNVGTTGTGANFTNTVFDSNATTPIANGGPPFLGRFEPQQDLSAFNGKSATGVWTLVIQNDAAAGTARNGALLSWSLSFATSQPGTGLGEPVADQATVGFMIQATNPTNPLTHQTWTAIGPASTVNDDLTTGTGPSANGDSYSGQVGAIAVDPSDPSGNTVYVAGSSGGIWKTTDFLTTSANGPTYVPLTNFGPTFGMNIGSITVFGRNNNPNQSIIFASTGFGDGTSEPTLGSATRSVGFLRSMDGGATWTLLDSTNNNLPFASRDHLFDQVDPTTGQGTTSFKIVVDPHPTPTGQVIVYAAMSGLNGGLWRSIDTGQTWQKMSVDSVQGTNATDVALDLNSATVDAVSNPTGNVNTIFAAFSGTGVYISPNRGQSLNLMAGNGFDPLIRDPDFAPAPAIIVQNGTFPTNPGRIVLATPTLLPPTSPGNISQNQLYSGWLYAAVSSADGSSLLGLFLTKDDGATWTKINLSNVPIPNVTNPFVLAIPTNDPTQTQYSMTSTPGFPNASNYNLAVTVDPTNPQIVYLGGTSIDEDSGLIRINVANIFDSHSAVPFDNTRPDGGQLYYSTAGRIQIKSKARGFPVVFTSDTLNQFNGGTTFAGYTNLIQDPQNPFSVNTTIFLQNVNSVGSGNNGTGIGFTNDGSGITWIPFDQLLSSSQDSSNNGLPSTNIHRMIAEVDPLTGLPRLIVGDDQGIFTGVDNNGKLDAGIGSQKSVTYSRNGDLQIAQFYYGAAQPSAAAALIAQAMAYGNGPHIGIGASDPSVLTNGNLSWTAPSQNVDVATLQSSTGFASLNGVLSTELDGVGVQTGQQGDGTVYQYIFPGLGGGFTDFFQVSQNGGPFISRTTGLIQNNGVSDPQWPTGSVSYGDGIVQGEFTVNPLNDQEVIISSAAGRIFSTINAGKSWLVIGDPTALDGSYAPALTYGAPDPSSPAGIGNLNNFIYAGTINGNIFVTTTGGGTTGQGNAWTNISTGLDGSPVLRILADPTRGSHDAYAVTENGVYYTANSLAVSGGFNPQPIWTNITGNLLSIMNAAPFGDKSLASVEAQFLTSIAADWRYVIPTDPTKPVSATNPTHPVLYVSGQSGVYRSLDNGTTWSLFPSMAFDGAPADGGELPIAQIRDLSMAIGNIDPTTGRAVAQPGDPNNLFAATLGAGMYTIRLAPIVFPNTAAAPNNIVLDPSISAGTNGSGVPLVSPSTAQPIINGFSEQTAFGNTVFISIYDLSNPSSPRLIGGYDPNNAATAIAANETDSSGHFSVQINPASFSSNGPKNIGIQATDNSGTTGNMATFSFILQAKNLGLPQPPTQPTIGLLPTDDTSGGKLITNVTQPHIVGTTDPGITVQLFISSGGNPTGSALATATSDVNGNYTLQFPTPLPNGPVSVQVKATNSFGSTVSPVLNFTIKTTGPTTAPTLGILAADDTGIKGDGITSNRRPHFTGTTDPGATVFVYNVNDLTTPLAQTTADGSGNYSVQLPSNLSNGTLTLEARASDVAGNQGPLSAPFTVTIVTVAADFSGNGQADLALFKRSSPLALWMIEGVQGNPPASSTPFGNGSVDIPILGDFNGDGKEDLAYYDPTTAEWFAQGIFAGAQYGQAMVDIPVPGDYFGNGVTTIATYRPTTGQWFIAGSSAAPAVLGGMPGDVPVPGDYAGTGQDQIAIYRPSTAQFFIGSNAPITLGSPGEIPVPANYDDSTSYHHTEPAVFNPSTGVLTIMGPGGTTRNVQFAPGSIPAPADYFGTGQADAAAFRPSTGAWTVYTPGSSTPQTFTFGAAGEVPVAAPYSYRKIPVAGDYAGVGAAQLALFQPTTPNATWRIQGNPAPITFGNGKTDVPIQGDFNGDGKTDLAVYRPSTATWIVQGVYPNGVSFGQPNVDIPAPADYNGTGTTSLGTFRPTTGQWFVAGNPNAIAVLGKKGDTPVPGNYDGTGKAEVAVFEPASGGSPTQWKILGPGNVVETFAFGGSKDVPVPGTYDGNGKTQIAVFRPSTDQWFIAGDPVVRFGGKGDIPVPGDYDGVGHTEIAVYRPSTGQLFVAGHGPVTVGGNASSIPANAPYSYRALSARSSTTTKSTITAQSLNMGSQAVALSSASAPATTAASTISAASITTPPAPSVSGARPNQQVETKTQKPKLTLTKTRATHVHDKALAALLARLDRAGS